MSNFNNRVFGCAIIKSINSNYNADFSHQPRTLPNGVVYATDKALKYAIKNYLKNTYPNDKVFYFKQYKDDFIPMTLEESYNTVFSTSQGKEKNNVAKNLLSCLDIRCFGSTFAMKSKSDGNVAISIHGPVQINHGVNIWKENNIFSEQIMSPFRNQADDKKKDDKEDPKEKNATTLGRQSKLQEGHYLHHFSVNPQNLQDVLKLAGEGASSLSFDDISKLKNALRNGVTYYDSAAKAGTDNEFLLWVQLKSGSKKVLPNFTQLIRMDKVNEKIVFDLTKVKSITDTNADDIESIEIYYQKESVDVQNAPPNAKHLDITSGK